MTDPYFSLVRALRDEIKALEAAANEKDEWLAELRAGKKSEQLMKMGMTKRDAEAMAQGADNTLAKVIPELKKILRDAESDRLRLVRRAPHGGNHEEPKVGRTARVQREEYIK
jgi:hypothetical protein